MHVRVTCRSDSLVPSHDRTRHFGRERVLHRLPDGLIYVSPQILQPGERVPNVRRPPNIDPTAEYLDQEAELSRTCLRVYCLLEQPGRFHKGRSYLIQGGDINVRVA